MKDASPTGDWAAIHPTVAALLASGKGLLAIDESFPTIAKRFQGLGIAVTEENRRAYRELLCAAPGLADAVSGVILFDETLRQKIGTATFPEMLAELGIVPGIKVDLGTCPLVNFPGERVTQGLDGLRERLAGYRALGARFTKWRAVIAIGDGLPTAGAIAGNARALARFAALSQEAGLVPIVEPEILMDGAHAIERCEEVATATLMAVFAALCEQRVALESILLKTGMVLSGKACPEQADTATVAEATYRCLSRAVPPAVPGIVFLSGGQADLDATERLNAVCRGGRTPWHLSFSFGRALQDAAMRTWDGSRANLPAAQAALLHRAKCNSLAVLGRYSRRADLECAPAEKSP
jgi:fructose-bisphosphate aldolase class I